MTAQSRQKSYAYKRQRDLEFEVEDHVFLKVMPVKSPARFGNKGKLAPHYIGPFEILERVGAVAYQLALPPAFSHIHNVFHVSMLRKYLRDPSHVLMDRYFGIRHDTTYQETPVEILGRKEHQQRNKVVQMVKLHWQNHTEDEATWEREDEALRRWPHLFPEAT